MRWEPQIIQLTPDKKLRFDAHEILGNRLIGISGYGKTSLLQNIYTHYRCKEKMAYMKQDILLHPDLTVYETLWFYNVLRCKEECSQIEDILYRMGMSHLTNSKVSRLSGGEKKQVMIAYHLLDRYNRFLLMDEPFSGIDPENRTTLFSLMVGKKKTCTLLFTIHNLDPFLSQQLDEIWTIVPSSTGFHLEIYNLQENFSEIMLSEPENELLLTPTIHQWKHLFLRDRLMNKKQSGTVFLRWLIPLLVVAIQQILIGSFPTYLKKWMKNHEMLVLMEAVLTHTVLLFTLSISPMHMLNDHFQQRLIIYHEIDQGLYRKNDYFFSAILWDQMLLVLISLCIVLMLMPPDDLLVVTLFNVMTQMASTNMMMWICSYFRKASFHTTLILVSIYISIAFIGNMGLLLRVHSFGFLQYMSTTHLQSNLFLERIYEIVLDANEKEKVEYILSCINTHRRHYVSTWIGASIGSWMILISIMILICQFC